MAVNGGKERMLDVGATEGILKDSIFFCGSVSSAFVLNLLNTGNISDKYYLEITPAGWAFSIWGIIHAYQVIL